ncbi:MAG: serine/threonine-protein kinase [Anaerolineales bacterium]
MYQVDSLIIKRYKVLQAPDPANNILAGGMGMVYFCHDTKENRPVALKFIKPELLSDRSKREHFLDEGKAWIDLGYHPNIVRCYDVKNVDPNVFLVLELIDKEQGMKDASLRAWLDHGPIPLNHALLFSLQIARGMQYATDKIPGLVHRDLKPENLLIGTDKVAGTNVNRLRVTDFGLVRKVIDSIQSVQEPAPEFIKHEQLQYTQNAGTLGYMAPEQIEGKSLGVFTDIYALGCILYEMLTLQRGSHYLISQHLFEPIRNFLSRSMAANPKDRYQTWTEVTARARRYLFSTWCCSDSIVFPY